MLVRDKDISIEGDLGGEKVAMSIDQDSLLHLMSVLSDIYSDTPTAIVRELATNAIDSHIESGNQRPIEIHTPNSLNPKLKIQDFGIGMNAEDIRNIYSKYGASTKRDSNDYNGTLGIGAKSPLAYGGKTFTVVGVKDGVKTTVVVGYDPRSGGSMEIVDESKTDEQNGVTIIVPVNERRDHDRFTEAAKKFQLYAKFPVLVNGKAKTLPNGAQFLDDRILLLPRGRYEYDIPDVIVMGNVAYRIMPENRPQQLDYDRQVVFYADMGEVDFTPSREDLNYTRYTNSAIEKYSKLYTEKIFADKQALVDGCAGYVEAYECVRNIVGKLKSELHPYANFTYNGDVVPQIRWDFKMSGRAVEAYVDKETMWELATSDAPNMMPTVEGKLAILGYTNKTVNKFHVEKVNRYCKENGITFRFNLRFVTYYDEDQLKWYSNDTFVYWEDVKKIKLNLPKKPKAPKKERSWDGSGGAYVGSFTRFVPDKSKKIYYASRSDLSTGSFGAHSITPLADANRQIFIVTKSTLDKFKELYPNSEHVQALYREKVKEYINSLTDHEKGLLSRYSAYNNIKIPVNDPSEILDPRLREQTDNSEAQKAYERYEDAMSWLARLPYGTRDDLSQKMPTVSDQFKNLKNTYPLVPRWINRGSREAHHAVLYVNMIYKLNNEGNK